MANPNEDDLRVAREIATDTYVTLLPTETARLTRAIASMRAAQREQDARLCDIEAAKVRPDRNSFEVLLAIETCAAVIRAGNESQAGEKE